MRLWTQSSKETPEVVWENSAVSEQLARAGRAARRGGMWLSEAVTVGRRLHTLTSEALGAGSSVLALIWCERFGSRLLTSPAQQRATSSCLRETFPDFSPDLMCRVLERFYKDALGGE